MLNCLKTQVILASIAFLTLMNFIRSHFSVVIAMNAEKIYNHNSIAFLMSKLHYLLLLLHFIYDS